MSNVLVIMAHPDDAEISCFGSLLRYKSLGYRVKTLIISTGEHGISIADQKHHKQPTLAKDLRYQESLHAFEGTGIELDSLEFEDGALSLNKDLISAIEHSIKEYTPDILITHWHDKTGLDHQDHQVVSQACLNAAQRCPSIKTLLQAEPIAQNKCGFLPNYFINISTFFRPKMAALAMHDSQNGRYYLTEPYHLNRCQHNSLQANPSYFGKGLLFEAFYQSFAIEL